MATGVNEFFDYLREGIEAPGMFRAAPYYCAESDTLFFYASDVPSFAKRLNAVLTVFLSTDTKEVVGFRVKGVQRILKTMRALGYDKFVIDNKGIRLFVFLHFARIVPPDDPTLQSYDDALDQYNDVIVDQRELQLI